MITKEEYDNFCSILNNPGYLGNFYRGSRAYLEIENMKIRVKEYEEAMNKKAGAEDDKLLSGEVS